MRSRPWTERVAELGAQLVSARAEAIEAIAPVFGERAGELGLPEGTLRYEAAAPTVAALEERLDADLERGSTGLGPHLDDVEILAGDRDLRRFGSQGEQRLAVLSLILAEAALLAERGPAPPLAPARRRALGARRGASHGARAAAGRPGPDADHRDRSLRAAGRARAARAGDSRSGEVKPERIGNEVRSELARFGPAEGMTDIVRVLARCGRGSDRAERLAGAAGERPDAARRDRVLDLGLRARAAGAEAARAPARGSRRALPPRLFASRPASFRSLLRTSSNPPARPCPSRPPKSASSPRRSPPGSRTKAFAKSLRRRLWQASGGRADGRSIWYTELSPKREDLQGFF